MYHMRMELEEVRRLLSICSIGMATTSRSLFVKEIPFMKELKLPMDGELKLRKLSVYIPFGADLGISAMEMDLLLRSLGGLGMRTTVLFPLIYSASLTLSSTVDNLQKVVQKFSDMWIGPVDSLLEKVYYTDFGLAISVALLPGKHAWYGTTTICGKPRTMRHAAYLLVTTSE